MPECRQSLKVGQYIAPPAIYSILFAAINLLRMVKLFGWESNMSAEVDSKRQVELVYLWKRKVLDLVNGCIE
jgi:hypothetical protein